MQTQKIEGTDLTVGRLAYGCMRIAGTWNPSDVDANRRANAHACLKAAFDAGYTLFDHADIYAQGACETLHGELLKDSPSMRRQIVIATKCGIRFPGDPEPASPHRYDFSKEHILRSCEASLKRLQIETIDIYQLHRPDLLMDPDEVGEAFDELHRSGKVRYFGVSNFLPSFVTALQKGLGHKLVVNQVEIHLGRLAPFVDGTLDQCLSDKITPLAWSPLGGGWLGDGGSVGSFDLHRRFVLQALDEVRERLGCSRTALSLAWLLKHPSKIIPIVGSAHPDRIRQAVESDRLQLDREDWYRLLVAARGEALP